MGDQSSATVPKDRALMTAFPISYCPDMCTITSASSRISPLRGRRRSSSAATAAITPMPFHSQPGDKAPTPAQSCNTRTRSALWLSHSDDRSPDDFRRRNRGRPKRECATRGQIQLFGKADRAGESEIGADAVAGVGSLPRDRSSCGLGGEATAQSDPQPSGRHREAEPSLTLPRAPIRSISKFL